MKLTDLTPEQKRIAIAEACGYVNVHKFDKWKEGGPMRDGTLIGDETGKRPRRRAYIPDYLNDLNAMHEAEKTLTAEQWHEYDRLMPLRDPQKIHATAAQRADAFLLATGRATV